MRSTLFLLFTTCLISWTKPASCQSSPAIQDPLVFGIFDGRTPCREIAVLLHQPIGEECIKIKWRLTLFQDATTHQPSTYTLKGFIYKNESPRKGTWVLITGTKADPGAVVYRLDAAGEEPLYLQKGDDNVLFFLDRDLRLIAGNSDFSFTLNRKDNGVPL